MVLDFKTAGALIPGLKSSEGSMEPKMVMIKVLRSCFIDGIVRGKNAVVTISQSKAIELISVNKAEIVLPEAPEKKPDAGPTEEQKEQTKPEEPPAEASTKAEPPAKSKKGGK